MERRDKLVLLLLLAGAGWAGYEHWDTIVAKLGLDDLSPGRVKAIDLAKRDLTFERVRSNQLVLDERVRLGEIVATEHAWSAVRIGGGRFLVTYDYKERGVAQKYQFEVDTATNAVTLVDNGPPSPR
jgi:hypothetical protein